MSGKDKFIHILSRDDILAQIDDIEKQTGRTMDEGSHEVIVRAATGDMDNDLAELELKLRAARFDYIINRAPSAKLEECLSELTVAALRTMLSFIIHLIEESKPPDEYITSVLSVYKNKKDMHDIIIQAKMAYLPDLNIRKKKDLTADAYRLLSDRRVTERLMIGMGPESRKVYGDAVNGSSNASVYAVTSGLMFMFGGKKSDGYTPLSYIVPDEMKDVWLSLQEDEIRRCDAIGLYAAAAANLYGVIPGGELLYLIRRYDTSGDDAALFEAMDDYDLLLCVNLRCHDDESCFELSTPDMNDKLYVISQKYLMFFDELFPDAEDYGDYLYQTIEDKPRYFPPKSEFLKYADPKYYEQTPEGNALRGYIKKKYGKQIDKYLKRANSIYTADSGPVTQDSELDNLMEALHDHFVAEESDTEDIAAELWARGINPSDTVQLYKLIGAAGDKTRTWFNKGYLPEEIEEATLEMQDLQTQIFVPNPEPYNPDEEEDEVYGVQPIPDIQIPVRAEIKPGRNDPCPCGSGKKYKICCGR